MFRQFRYSINITFAKSCSQYLIEKLAVNVFKTCLILVHSRKSISNYVKNQKSNHVYVWHLLTNLILLQTPQNMIVYICFSFVFFTWHKLCNGKVLCHLAMPRSSHLVILLYITGNLANQRQVGIFTKYRSLQVLK